MCPARFWKRLSTLHSSLLYFIALEDFLLESHQQPQRQKASMYHNFETVKQQNFVHINTMTQQPQKKPCSDFMPLLKINEANLKANF